MALAVNTNLDALVAQRNLSVNNNKLGRSISRLSSGLRLNSAADDAAGLSIATKFAAQVKGINQAVRNANNAISIVQTAEGGVNTVTNILFRLRELAVQSASDDNTVSDRKVLTTEADKLIAELTRVANTTELNKSSLIDGTFKNKAMQIGPNANQVLNMTLSDVRGKAIGGRAEHVAAIADGVVAAVNEGFGAGEIKVNDTDVAATNAADDQFSVFSLASDQLGAMKSAGDVDFSINGNAVQITTTAGQAGSQIATSIVTAINAANITNVTARVVDGSAYVIEAKAGVNLTLAVSGTGASHTDLTGIAGSVGLGAVEANFGLGTTAGSAVTNNNGESSSIAKAVAINAVKSTTTVEATAIKNITTADSAIAAATLAAGDVYVNGVDIGAVTITAQDGTGALVTAINNQTSNTGVTAATNSDGKLILTASDGRNITVQGKNDGQIGGSGLGIASADVTNGTAVFRGTVRLNSEDTFTLKANSSLADLDGTSNTETSVSKSVSSFNVAGLKVDTQDNATAAILTIDAAIANVNTLRSELGAVQNRLEFAISNLQVAGENTSASESRIRDVDFASEVAIFTKNQILVQAGAAMLAQANTLPQVALQLLG